MANYGSSMKHTGKSSKSYGETAGRGSTTYRPRDAQGRFVSTGKTSNRGSRGSMGETTGRSSTTSRSMGNTSFGSGAYGTTSERGHGSYR